LTVIGNGLASGSTFEKKAFEEPRAIICDTAVDSACADAKAIEIAPSRLTDLRRNVHGAQWERKDAQSALQSLDADDMAVSLLVDVLLGGHEWYSYKMGHPAEATGPNTIISSIQPPSSPVHILPEDAARPRDLPSANGPATARSR